LPLASLSLAVLPSSAVFFAVDQTAAHHYGHLII
jgi:hypothetical protein